MNRRLPVEGEALLVEQWRAFALWIARDYFIPGASHDDVRQEAMIGLLVGLRSFDPELGALRSFLHLAITRRLLDVIGTANRDKHRPLNQAVSGSVTTADGEVDIFDMLPAPGPSTEEQFEQQERVNAIIAAARKLTQLERESLLLALNGEAYGHLPKRVDNAIARARWKLRRAA